MGRDLVRVIPRGDLLTYKGFARTFINRDNGICIEGDGIPTINRYPCSMNMKYGCTVGIIIVGEG